MAIVIPDMKIPTGCYNCPFCINEQIDVDDFGFELYCERCTILDVWFDNEDVDTRPDWKPSEAEANVKTRYIDKQGKPDVKYFDCHRLDNCPLIEVEPAEFDTFVVKKEKKNV